MEINIKYFLFEDSEMISVCYWDETWIPEINGYLGYMKIVKELKDTEENRKLLKQEYNIE